MTFVFKVLLKKYFFFLILSQAVLLYLPMAVTIL